MGAAGPAMGMQAVGSGFSAYAAYQQGLAQQGYYNYLANNAATEQGLIRRQADQEEGLITTEGLNQAKTLQRKVSETYGAQAAGSAANVGPGSVTTADIVKDTFDKANLDQMAIRYNADVKQWQTENAARMKIWDLKNQQTGYDFAAKNAKTSGKMAAISSLLGGSSQVAGTGMRASQ